MLSALGETVTLIPDDTNEVISRNVTLTALYQHTQDHLQPLDGTRQGESRQIVCATSAITGIDTLCQIKARGEYHQVLSVITDGSGFSTILLSDPWVEE